MMKSCTVLKERKRRKEKKMDLITNQLIMRTLNLKEEEIESISGILEDRKEKITVRLKKEIDVSCPVCGSIRVHSNGVYTKDIKFSEDLFPEKKVSVQIRRYVCKDCGKGFSDEKHLSPRYSSVSYQTIVKLMGLLTDPHITFKSSAAQCGISESTAIRLFDRYCHIRKAAWPEAICMDEVYAKNTDFDSKYICIFYDFMRHTILDVLPDRKKNYLFYYFSSKESTGELLNVKYVCIDMNATYLYIARKYFKKAVICADSFHVVKQLNDSFSKIRIRIMKRYEPSSIEYYLLKHFRFLLMRRDIDLDNKARWNKRLQRYINYRGLREMILSIDKELEKAFELKERYICFNASSSYEEAVFGIGGIIDDFRRGSIPEYEEFTSMITRWKKEILDSFLLYRGRRVNNGVAENVNATVSLLLYNTKGIRNHERRRKRIMYCVNKEGFLLK